jgi:nucleoside phosphorylase
MPTEKKKPGRGGARKGAGRPAIGDYVRMNKTLRLDADVHDFLSDQPNASQFVDALVKCSKAFKDWKSE